MDEKIFRSLRPAVFHFPAPAHPLTASPAGAGHFLRAVLENIVFALHANYEQVLSVRPGRAEQIHLTGGLTNSRLFCQILSDCMGLPVSVGRIREASALGAAICAAAGIRAYPDLTNAQKAMVRMEAFFEPAEENTAAYRAIQERWRALYEMFDGI